MIDTVRILREDYPDEVIETAQIMGAKLMHEAFFPEWRVNLFFTAGNLKIDGGNGMFKLTMKHPDTGEEAVEHVRRVKKKRDE